MEQDCSCITHTGPHWLHMQRLWRDKNRELLASGSRLGNMAFVREEEQRLKQLEREMVQRGLQTVPGYLL